MTRKSDGMMPNIFLITIDSLRYDHLSLFHYRKDTTPFLKKLCLMETNCFYTILRANAPYTKAAFKSIMTGLLPFSKGAYHTIKGLPNIAKTLGSKGYKSLGIANNDILSGAFGYNEGFQLFITQPNLRGERINIRSKLKLLMSRYPLLFYKLLKPLKIVLISVYGKGGQVNPSIPSHSIVNFVGKFVRNIHSAKEKFFVWAHFMDTHYPYMFFEEFFEELHGEPSSRYKYYLHWITIIDKINLDSKVSTKDLEWVVKFYDAAIRTVDDAIFKLIRYLEDQNILDRTILIITADHGEEFLEHGAIGHVGRKYITHMYEELLNVPLIIIDFTEKIMDKSLAKKLHNVEWSQVDLYPTLCGLLNIKSCPSNIDGIDLTSAIEDKSSRNRIARGHRIVFSEASLFNAKRGTMPIPPNEKVVIAVKKGSWKYINYNNFKEEFYDLSSDPGETRNIIGNEVEELEELRSIAKQRFNYIRRMLIREGIRQRITHTMHSLR